LALALATDAVGAGGIGGIGGSGGWVAVCGGTVVEQPTSATATAMAIKFFMPD
jgi:hypothetical protein